MNVFFPKSVSLLYILFEAVVKGKANWQLTVETVESGISLGHLSLLSTISLNLECGNRILVFIYCRLRIGIYRSITSDTTPREF